MNALGMITCEPRSIELSLWNDAAGRLQALGNFGYNSPPHIDGMDEFAQGRELPCESDGSGDAAGSTKNHHKGSTNEVR